MKRLDLILVEKKFYPSREKAKQAISSGRVKVDGQVMTKASLIVDENANFEVLPFEFVSRGGFKLQKALEEFQIDLKDKIVLDIGASTGGFTDVCLQAGAKKVYSVDTGENQLDETLRKNRKVINLDKTNFLNTEVGTFSDVEFIVIDVSFVSLTKFASKISADFKNIEIIALIKPQFECGLEYARKHKGIVKDKKVHEKVISNVVNAFEINGFKLIKIIPSPIKGGDGNTEFLAYFKK